MTIYKIHIDHRNYATWTVFNATTLETSNLHNFKPDDHKLFSNDVFTFNKGNVDIVHSSIRSSGDIPAVLILADNKTYGRDKTSKHGKLLYKCIPDDIRLPIFLVPYDIKHIGFSKVLSNLYVTINFHHWDEKHPRAILSQNIGPVDILDNFYEYQLYCKSLHASIQKFNKDTNKAIQNKASSHDTFIETISNKYKPIQNRTDWKIFSIDPATSLDFDDAFSITTNDKGNTLLSIYIANVTILLDSLSLWNSFSRRISTIYLPDRKRPMLPTILSDCLCSLQKHVRRFAFVLDIEIDTNYNIVSTNYSNCLIKVFNNFSYEESSLLNDPDYQKLLTTGQQLNRKYKYISNIKTSHDIVCYLMILMNYNCAQKLLEHKNGIFRSTIIKQNIVLPTSLPDDVTQFIKIWNSTAGQYIDISKETIFRHDSLELDSYIHITSPIRRLVDMLNIIKFQQNFNIITLSPEADLFYNKWISELEYINVTMRAIRKVQNDCTILDMCYNQPETLDKHYEGFCFDKLVRNDGLYQFMVYIPEIKLTTRITLRENLDNFEKRNYKLFLFNDEEKFKKKIRLQLVE